MNFPVLTPEGVKRDFWRQALAEFHERIHLTESLLLALGPDLWPDVEAWLDNASIDDMRNALEHAMHTGEFPPPTPLLA